jgi:hypothetical protein
MDEFFGERVLLVAGETQVSTLGMQIESILTLVWIMTPDAVAIGDRCVEMVLQHHVAFFFVTAETEFISFRRILERVVLFVRHSVTDRTNTRPYGSVDEFPRANSGVAIVGNTAGIALAVSISGNYYKN